MSDENVKYIQGCDGDKCLALNIAKQNKIDIESMQRDSMSDKITLAVIEKTVKTLEENMIKFSIKLDELLSKPSKRWESLISAGLGALVVYLITQMLA